jgi:hypothetical protein
MFTTLEEQNQNKNAYEQFYYQRDNNRKKKFFCTGLLSVILGYGMGLLTCHLSNIC